MPSNTASSWPTRFELTTCAASEIADAIPPALPGVAVIYSRADDETETIYLVLESRAGSLRELCARRLETAKIPAGTALTVSFKCLESAGTTPEAVAASCRAQVIAASELRRELRPAMR
jgi:hypothetical protein